MISRLFLLSIALVATVACGDTERRPEQVGLTAQATSVPPDNPSCPEYALTVTKTAEAALERTWTWTIDKSADKSNLSLSEGETRTVSYTVEVSPASTESFAVSGTITIENNTPLDATITDVSDEISDFGPVDVDCGVTLPYTLEAGSTLECEYSTDLPNALPRTNTATVTTYGAVGGGQDTAAVDFGSATVEDVDECVDVSDTNVGPPLGMVCAGDLFLVFNYSLSFGTEGTCADVILVCGESAHINVASFETNDTGATGESSWTVHAQVDCEEGCTLTPGYWKTHSEFGPAPYDNTWAELPDGAGTEFFLSGQTYYAVLWTPPKGNVYYILAHAYIAAKLNILSGASSTPLVNAAIAWAETFFNTKTPAQAALLSKSQREDALKRATLLDNYNNGLIGPGHCSD